MNTRILSFFALLGALALGFTLTACMGSKETAPMVRHDDSKLRSSGGSQPVDYIYYIEEVKGYRHFEIKEFNVGKRVHRTVGEFEPAGPLWSVAISRDGKYFFYSNSGIENHAVGILARDSLKDVFEKVADVPLEERGIIKSIIYDDWDGVLYVYYGKFPSEIPKGRWLPPIELSPCMGRIDMCKIPYEIEPYNGGAGELLFAISESCFYVKRGGEVNGTKLYRVDKQSKTSTDLLTIPKQKDPYKLIILEGGDKYLFERMIMGPIADSEPYIHVYFDRFNDGPSFMKFGEPTLKLRRGLFVKPFQPPGREAIVLEEGPSALHGPLYLRVYLLDLVTLDMERVFEHRCSTSNYTCVIGWLEDPASFDPREPSSRINHIIEFGVLLP